MVPLLLLVLVFTTSLGAYWAGTRWLGYSRRLFRLAFERTVETIGLALVFFGFNVAIVVLVVLVLRTLGTFASPTRFCLSCQGCRRLDFSSGGMLGGRKESRNGKTGFTAKARRTRSREKKI